MIKKITLLELNKSINDTLKKSFSDSIWVIAEISELKVNRNGHCYLELVEKDAIKDNIIAKTRATIWAFTFRMLKPYFESATGYELETGLKVLVQANVEFHELYGLSLNITDIDPNYTLGDIAQKRIQIINRLEEDGVLNMNKDLELELVPQKIAIISSDTAAGYQDFINQLNNNTYKFKYYYKLFPSIMQGLQAEDSIISSLEKIYNFEDYFDVVVIIRGGGSQSDLNCFDGYNLASNVAQFSLPVLTGIGHDKDESIVDIVAYKKLKTPTAVAEFLIERTLEFENSLYSYKTDTSEYIFDYLNNQKSILKHYSSVAIPVVKTIIEKNKSNLRLIKEKVNSTSKNYIINKGNLLKSNIQKIKYHSHINLQTKHININRLKDSIIKEVNYNFRTRENYLMQANNKLSLLNPKNILKRGYSITYLNNKRITKYTQVKENDIINTKLFQGNIRSSVKGKPSKN